MGRSRHFYGPLRLIFFTLYAKYTCVCMLMHVRCCSNVFVEQKEFSFLFAYKAIFCVIRPIFQVGLCTG